MKATPALLQFGLGRLGRAAVAHYLAHPAQYGGLRYLAIGDRSGLWVARDGWEPAALAEMVGSKQSGVPLSRWRPDQMGVELIPGADAYRPTLLWRLDEMGIRRGIVLDLTAPHSGTAPLLTSLRRSGYDVVPANRAPLGDTQEAYDHLVEPWRGRVRWEAAVGAPVPLADVLRRSAWGGSQVREIVALPFPGANAILHRVTHGSRFSDAVRAVGEEGLLHSDPREDLDGHDARRLGVLLARALGQRVAPEEVRLEPLLPAEPPRGAGTGGRQAAAADTFYAERAWLAGERGRVLGYTLRVGAAGVAAGLEELPAAGPYGQMEPGDTLFALYTESGGERPVLLQGPAAGPGRAATALFADVVSLLGYN